MTSTGEGGGGGGGVYRSILLDKDQPKPTSVPPRQRDRMSQNGNPIVSKRNYAARPLGYLPDAPRTHEEDTSRTCRAQRSASTPRRAAASTARRRRNEVRAHAQTDQASGSGARRRVAVQPERCMWEPQRPRPTPGIGTPAVAGGVGIPIGGCDEAKARGVLWSHLWSVGVGGTGARETGARANHDRFSIPTSRAVAASSRDRAQPPIHT
jgi:hypothetical protein